MAHILRSILAFFLILTFAIAQDTQIPLVCRDGVQIIAVVGANVPNGTQSYGLTLTFVQNVMAAIPNSANFSVNYDRFPPANQPANMSAQTFTIEVDEGVGELSQVLLNYTTACPSTPIVLHGYSQGAVIIMNLLCGASSGLFQFTGPLNASYISQSMY